MTKSFESLKNKIQLGGKCTFILKGYIYSQKNPGTEYDAIILKRRSEKSRKLPMIAQI